MKLARTISMIVFLALISGIAVTVRAQEDQNNAQKLSEMNLEDLLNMQVTTASKKAEKTTDAPGVITTITADEIKYFGANDLMDILERATSIQTLGSSLFPNNLTVMRGDLRTHYNSHVLLLINGRPTRDGIQGGLDAPVFTGFPVEMIERIEIIRGPGSVLYGSNAFVGVINVITKNDNSNSSFGAKVTAGSFGTIKGVLSGSYVKDDFNAKLSAKIDNIDGWDYSAMTVRPGFPNSPANLKYGQKNLGLAVDLSYKELSFFGFYTNDVQDVLGILPYTTYAGKNKYERVFLNLGYSHKFSDAWEASVNLTENGSDLKFDDEAAVPADHHSNADYLVEVTLNGELAKDLNLVFGGIVDSRNKNTAPTGDVISPYHQTNLSAYLQADYRPVELLKLIAGGQLNKPDGGSWDFVPRIGAICNFSSEFGVKALYSSAFRSPWPGEQLLHASTITGNPNLTPEKIATLDIQLFYSSKKGELSLTYYNSAYSNSITRQAVPNKPGITTYVNQGDLHMNGFEFEGKTSISSSIFITGSATIQNNADENTVMVYIPTFMFKVGAFYKTKFGLTAGIYNTYFGKPKENAGKQLNPAANAVDLVSVNLNYKLPTSLPLELNVYVKNLLNTEYNYTEFNRGWVNTLPVQSGTAVYASVGLNL